MQNAIREVRSEQLIGNNSPAFVKFNWNHWEIKRNKVERPKEPPPPQGKTLNWFFNF
jgi:hypothetical protein